MNLAMIRSKACRITLQLALVVLLPGCALFRADPVPEPPPPPETVALARGGTPDELSQLLVRNPAGEIRALRPLEAAREAIEKAAASQAVARYADDALDQAQTRLGRAQSLWQTIAEDPLDQPRVLARAAHAAHQAERWGQIALAVADRETGLRRLADVQGRLARRDAADAKWRGQQLVPGRFGEVRFELGTARLTADSAPVVDRLASFLREHPRYHLRLVGHTDDTAPSDASLEAFVENHPEIAQRADSSAAMAAGYNRVLSEQRAGALRQALIEAGVAPERLQAEGRGAGQPVADNSTAAGRRKNRRVEVIVVVPGTRDDA